MKLYTLMEDTACSSAFVCEHGLSFYIEANGRRLLFDMGQTDRYLQNARTLGVRPEAVDAAFVSHGHYDHGGGLAAFLEINRAIGLDPALQEDERLILTDGVTVLDENMTLFSDVPGQECCPGGNRTLYEQEDGQYVPDRFLHEQSLILREQDKVYLLTGCAHRGVVNICARAKEIIGRDPDVVIGGMHLFSPSTGKSEPDEAIHAVAARLKQTGSRYYTCHCTGQHAFAVLRETLGEQIAFLTAGSVLEL